MSKSLSWRVKLFLLAHKTSIGSAHYNPFTYLGCLYKSYKLYQLHGFLPDEAMKLGLLNSKGGLEGHFISKSRLMARQKFLNHPSFQEITEDKAVFYTYCARMGLPTPRLLGLFFKSSSGLQWGQRPLTGESQWEDFFDNYCPPEFVVKPGLGVYGEGILFIEKNSPGYSGTELFRKLQTHPKYHCFVVQECLQNHPDIMAINSKKGLQTVRVITLIDNDLRVNVVYAFFKFIVGNNRIDNHKGGELGNLLCEINLQDGHFKVPLLITAKGPVSVPKHPETDREIEGTKLPCWEEICDLAVSVAPNFLPMRSIGWDIALTPEGPKIIEGNARWDPPMFGNFGESESVFSMV